MACSFTGIELMLRFRRRKPRVLQAFVQTFFTRIFLFKSFLLIKLRYLDSSSYSRGCPWGVIEFDRIFISSDKTFFVDEKQFSICLPICKFVEILLQMLCIFSGFYSHVYNGVVCKQSNDGVQTDWNIVYIYRFRQGLRLTLGTLQIQRIYGLIFTFNCQTPCFLL